MYVCVREKKRKKRDNLYYSCNILNYIYRSVLYLLSIIIVMRIFTRYSIIISKNIKFNSELLQYDEMDVASTSSSRFVQFFFLTYFTKEKQNQRGIYRYVTFANWPFCYFLSFCYLFIIKSKQHCIHTFIACTLFLHLKKSEERMKNLTKKNYFFFKTDLIKFL